MGRVGGKWVKREVKVEGGQKVQRRAVGQRYLGNPVTGI